MSYAKPWSKAGMQVAAAGLVAGGLIGLPAPAHALPPVPLAPAKCEQWVFPGFTSINWGGLTQLTFTSNEATVNGPFNFANEQQPNISGGVSANGHVELTFPSQQFTEQMSGDVNADGHVTNGVAVLLTPDGPANNVSWNTNTPLKCAKETAKEGPTVSFEPILGGLNVHITDRSGVTSQCTYDADGFTRTFRLDANSSTDLEIVPAIPKFDNWNINIKCDNGTSTQTTQFF